MRNLYWLLLLIFIPSKFRKISTKDAIKKEFESNQGLLNQFPDRKLSKERELEFLKDMKDSSLKLRKSIIDSFISLMTVILSAYIFAKLTKYFYPMVSSQLINFLRFSSICIIFWSVWGKLGTEIQTYKQQTLPEILNKNWSKTLYLTGIFLVIMSYFLQ